MSRMKLNHWFVGENNLNISLLRAYAEINILKNDEFVFYQTCIKIDGSEKVTLNFYSLEDAVSFVENVVSKVNNNDELIKMYDEMFKQDMFMSIPSKVKETNGKITLTPDEVEGAIIDYFGKDKSYRVSVKTELSVHNRCPDIKYYIVEHLNYDGIKKNREVLLTEGDLKNALSNYIEFYGYNLEDFHYIGGVHNTGYFFDEDTAHYEGIELSVKKKDIKHFYKNTKENTNK